MIRQRFAFIAAIGVLISLGTPFFCDKLLIPMDLTQTDHLKAYGVAFHVLQAGGTVEWLLNYRGGSFLADYQVGIERECALAGVRWEVIPAGAVLDIYQTIQAQNMEAILLEKAPRIAVYIPHNSEPWDDAVTLALDYADIPYDRVWDEEVLSDKLMKYDWLHLHHEDFTGQYGKFYAAYHTADWYRQDVKTNQEMAQRLGFPKVSRLKLAVALTIREYVKQGGFIFSMCSACDTYDIGLAAQNTDICHEVFDGDPIEPGVQEKLDYKQTFAFEDFQVELDPLVYEHSTIDVTRDAQIRGPNVYFALFDFSAKFDPVPTMLVQDHTALVKEFMGQCTGFHRAALKTSALVLGEVAGTDEIKYLHGNYGKGTFTYLGGHDPEDFEHMVLDPPTDLSNFKNSPGYRLLLNNVLFPAARKKELKT